jgi:SAM-dependent methyltransferase
MFRWARGFWRMLRGCYGTSPRTLVSAPFSLRTFVKDWRQFRRMGGVAPFHEIAPQLFDRDRKTQSGGGHYFFQDIWALTHLNLLRPALHYDIGSRIDGFAGQASAICQIVYVDIRPPNFEMPRFEFRKGSILELPFADGSIGSLSCLHVVEHIGLGRYGDLIDPDGPEKALRELERILAPGGQLLLSMPVGRERVEFNAQRVWHPIKPLELFSDLKLLEFSAVNDRGEFVQKTTPDSFAGARYACGLYRFTKVV